MTSPITRFGAHILFLPLLMIAAAVLVKGYADIGDGFSAGVIASLAVILQAVAFGPVEFDRLPLVRFAPLATFAGLLIALSTAFVPVLFGEPILYHYPPAGEKVVHVGAVELITPVAFDIGVFLVVIGFCVGSLAAVAREIARRQTERTNLRFERREPSLATSRPRAEGDL
jgi:multisubunit Na+/H+ antiporter MnhB subunit